MRQITKPFYFFVIYIYTYMYSRCICRNFMVSPPLLTNNKIPQNTIFDTLSSPSVFSSFCCLAEKEQRGELWRGQRGGDPGEQALWGRPGRLGSVHTQGVSHRQTHPVLVLCHSASSCPSSGGGVLECLPLYTNPVRQTHKKCCMNFKEEVIHHTDI